MHSMLRRVLLIFQRANVMPRLRRGYLLYRNRGGRGVQRHLRIRHLFRIQRVGVRSVRHRRVRAAYGDVRRVRRGPSSVLYGANGVCSLWQGEIRKGSRRVRPLSKRQLQCGGERHVRMVCAWHVHGDAGGVGGLHSLWRGDVRHGRWGYRGVLY